MRPLDDFPLEDRCGLGGIVFDLDLTLNAEGKLAAPALTALEQAKAAGLVLVPVTAAAAGTCDHLARIWPVDAVIGENGGFMFHLHPQSGRMVHLHILSRDERRENWQNYEKALARIMQEVPGAALAADQAYRETDLAIDHAQDLVQPLAEDAVVKIIEIMREAGMTVSRTATHVHGWLGPYDKAVTTRLAMNDLFAVNMDDDAGRTHFMFIGDGAGGGAPDGSLFDLFPHSVGVGDVRGFETSGQAKPAFVTGGDAAQGFVDAVQAVVAARASGDGPAGGDKA